MENKENIMIDDLDSSSSSITNSDENTNEAKWYIVTSITGNEDTVYKNIEDKVRAYNLEEVVQEIKLLKTREITIEVFDPINNPPPSRFRNTKSITWESLPGNRYKKTRIRYVNKFPGYIYIKMLMADDAWYIIRNTFGVTGFVGSSGKGAKPIPMSDFEVQNLFDPKLNEDIIIKKTPDSYVELTVEKPKEQEKKMEFLTKADSIDEDGFFDSKIENKVDSISNDIVEEDAKPISEEKNEVLSNDNEYLENHEQVIDEIIIEEKNELLTDQASDEDNAEENELEFIDIHSHGNSQNKSEFPIGSLVELVSGSMQGYDAIVKEIDLENKKAKVAIDMLGRETIIDVEFSELRKKSN